MSRSADGSSHAGLWTRIDPDGELSALSGGDVGLVLEVLDELAVTPHLLTPAGFVARRDERGRWQRTPDIEDVVHGLLRSGLAWSGLEQARERGENGRWAHPITITSRGVAVLERWDELRHTLGRW
jgi:hypothetical protein